MSKSLRIGFIDHHLANFHADTFFNLIPEVSGGEAQVTIAFEIEPRGDVDWCAARGVRRAQSPEEVTNDADAIMVLAPDNFEVHRGLAITALQAGLPVFVDKFLAPTLREAREIIEAAEKGNVPLMASSALRYAGELEQLPQVASGEVDAFFARGMGNWSGYGVHTLAMPIRYMAQLRVKRVANVGRPGADVVAIEFENGVRGSVEVRQAENQYSAIPWQLGLLVGGNYHVATIEDYEGFYRRLIAAVLQFFSSGISPTSAGELLDVVGVLEAAEKSREADGRWVAFKDLE
ncbi:MAG: Gfo/Idh/MocA family oxidoreductase [Candidatus Sumerlaeaceae bacterium]|nr:Gfo/Idh/MocA family oxidoreductase [Candidatus Sumerlaeaceae bacterium]